MVNVIYPSITHNTAVSAEELVMVTADEELVMVTADEELVMVTADEELVMVAADEELVMVAADEELVMVAADEELVMVAADGRTKANHHFKCRAIGAVTAAPWIVCRPHHSRMEQIASCCSLTNVIPLEVGCPIGQLLAVWALG